jgi:hypothetical protein
VLKLDMLLQIISGMMQYPVMTQYLLLDEMIGAQADGAKQG